MIYQINGVSYHVESCGDGFPLLLLHGFTGDYSTWSSFCGDWGKHSKLIMPDILGHGKTDSPHDTKRYSIELLAKDLNSLLHVMGISQVDLLGYSMGGRLALTFAILYPEKVRRLILESSSPGLPTKEEQDFRCMKDNELAEFILEKGVLSFVEYWENIPLFSTMKRQPDQVKEMIRKQRLSNNPRGLAGSLKGMGTGVQPSWWKNLQSIEHQVLLVTGDLDTKFCFIAEKMMGMLKKGTWMTISNSGHANHVEEREKFATIVSDFLTNT